MTDDQLPPAMNPCFVCRAPATGFRSLTMLTSPPASPSDAVPICHACDESWTFALTQNLHADLLADAGLPIPTSDRSTHKPSI